MKNKLTRKFIEKNTVSYRRKTDGTRPDVRVVDCGEKKIVVKDFRYTRPRFRYIFGIFLAKREYRTLCKLRDIKNIPNAICMIDRYAFAMEYINGVAINNADKKKLSNDFYEKALKIINEIHKKKIVHVDLRSRGNIIVGDDSEPYIIDFAAAINLKSANPLNKIFKQFILSDKHGIYKMKKLYSPELFTEDDKKMYKKTFMPIEKIGKNPWYKLRSIIKRGL